MKDSQESAPPCPVQKPLETSSCSKQQLGKQMGGRGQRSLAKSHALPLNYSETETGWHSLQYCLSLNLSRQYVTLGKGQPKEQGSASCQSSTGLTTEQAWLWELEAHGAAQLIPRQGHPTASKFHLAASPRETSIPAWFAHVLLSDPPPTY